MTFYKKSEETEYEMDKVSITGDYFDGSLEQIRIVEKDGYELLIKPNAVGRLTIYENEREAE